jgi:TPR repeat protein
MHEHGRGVREDPEEAARWYRKAAEGGDAMGQFNLALLCESGRGVSADEREAARWLQAAAEQGFADALERLGGYRAAGRGGLPRDATAAAETYYRAGLAYLQQDREDGARRCVEALRALEREGGLTPPHTTLAERLATALAGR